MTDATATTTTGVRWVSTDTVDVDLAGASNRDHIDALAQIERVRCQADAAQIEVIASAIGRAVHCDDGHRNLENWVIATLDTGRRSATQWVRRAGLGWEFPDYLTALRAGRFHLDHYDEIVRVAGNPRVRRQLGGYAERWADVAATRSFDEFKNALAIWADLVDQDGREPLDRQPPRRGLNVSKSKDGTVRLNGFYDPEAGQILREILNEFIAQENRIDAQAAAADLADGGLGITPRSAAERRADALIAALTQSLATPPGEPAKPLTTIVIGWHAAQQMLHGYDPAAPVNSNEQFCRSIHGEPIDIRAALTAILEGRIQVMVVDALGNPFALGKPGSLYPNTARQSLNLLHPHCEWDGCPAHGNHLQADHIQPRSRGGPTSMDNAAWLCGYHNRWRYTHDYHLHRNEAGRITATRPDGTPLTPTATA